MRCLMKVQIPVEAGNDGLKSGKLPRLMQQTLEELKPEAAYFTPEKGLRTAYIVFDLKDTADMVTIPEKLFQEVNAAVEIFPVMDQQDLMTGLERAGFMAGVAKR